MGVRRQYLIGNKLYVPGDTILRLDNILSEIAVEKYDSMHSA